MGELVLYDPEDTDELVTADLSAGYDVMFDKLKENYKSEQEAKSQLCRVIEASLLQEIQSDSNGTQLHHAIADLVMSLQETDEIDVDSLAQNSIHQLNQITE